MSIYPQQLEGFMLVNSLIQLKQFGYQIDLIILNFDFRKEYMNQFSVSGIETKYWTELSLESQSMDNSSKYLELRIIIDDCEKHEDSLACYYSLINYTKKRAQVVISLDSHLTHYLEDDLDEDSFQREDDRNSGNCKFTSLLFMQILSQTISQQSVPFDQVDKRPLLISYMSSMGQFRPPYGYIVDGILVSDRRFYSFKNPDAHRYCFFLFKFRHPMILWITTKV
jgi:hypothetical protein